MNFMIHFNPKKALSLFAQTGTAAFLQAKGVSPENAALAGKAAGAVIDGTSFKQDSTPLDRLRNAVSASIRSAFEGNGMELTGEFEEQLLDAVFSEEAALELLSAEDPVPVFEKRIDAAFAQSETYDTSTLPLSKIITDILENLDTNIKKDTAVTNLLTLYTVQQIYDILASKHSSSLRETLDALLEDVRKNHPSFKLMERDSIDRRLCPDVKDAKLPPSLGSVEKGAKKPVWALISESWKLPENHSIVIEGVGGIGKTVTLLRPDLQGTELPVPALYIPLYELVDKDDKCLSVDEYLERRLPGHKEEICDLAAQPWKNGPKLLFLLDGFNEIPQKHRFTALSKLNDWRKTRTGVQLIAVSRPMDSLDLSKELAGSPIALHLSPLEPDTVKTYLAEQNVAVPDENSPVWRVLTQPLFLVLYAKTDVLRGRTAAGYPLRPKEAVSGGALIWNYLQRELLRNDQEDWVLRCAVACQQVLPFVAYHMAKNHRFTIDREELDEILSSAVSKLNPKRLPKHLWELFDRFEDRYECYPDLSGVRWRSLIVHELGILVQAPKEGERVYAFLHQHFRDALAGMYLVAQAEAEPEGTLPEVWQTSHSPELMDYAAELMEEEDDTAQKLWRCVQTQNPPDKRCFYVQLELHSRRGADGLAKLDFSGMDLRDVSVARYGNGLFRTLAHTRGTQLNRATFEGVEHRGPVSCVAELEDGRVVSGAYDMTLRIWDPNTGDCVGVLEGHSSWVSCVAKLADGRIVSGSYDNTLRVWNLETKESRVLEGHTHWVRCVAALADGRIVSGSQDNTLRVWNPDTGECLSVLRGHTSSVTCVAVLSDGRIVSGSGRFFDSDDNTLRVWNPDTGESRVLKGHTRRVRCVAALADGRIVSGSDDNTLRVWNPNTEECLNVLEGHTNWVDCVAELSDGRIVSGSWDNTLRVWNPDTGECMNVLKGHTRPVNCVAVLSDDRIVSGSTDNTLLLWTTNSNTPQRRLGRVMPDVSCAVVVPGYYWATGHTDGSLRLWDASQRRYLRSLNGHTNSVSCLAALADGRIVSGSNDHTLRVWNPDTGESRVLEGHTRSVSCVAALQDGRILSGSNDNTLRVWNPDTGKSRVLMGHTDSVSCVVALSDGRLVSGSLDKTLRVWNPDTGECLNVLKGHTNGVDCVAALADGHIVSGSPDDTLRVWNPDTGECLNVLKGHSNYVNCVAALSDGRIVSGSRDNTLRAWNPDTGACLNVLVGHTGWVNCVLPLDSSHVLSSSRDCTLRLWNVNTGKCLCVIPVSEMEFRGIDFRGAEIDNEETARLLYYNGAEVPKKYTQKFLKEWDD